MKIDTVLIGNRIRHARLLRNMTADSLADTIGVAAVTLRHIETGANNTSLHTILNIADTIENHFKQIYYSRFDNGLIEFEYDHVFIGQILGDFTPNSAEVACTCYADIDELRDRIVSKPSMFTPWFILIFSTVYRYIKDRIVESNE